MPWLKAILADITGLEVDAIVNAANSRLAGGGGVDGAIHRAAGYQRLLDATRQWGACPAGEVRITPGFRLPAAWIIHTVGPVWQGGQNDEPALLAACYRKSLLLSESHSVNSIAFPSISTGVFGYPSDQAAEVAVRSVRATLACTPNVSEVIFCCYSRADLALYRELVA